MNLEFIDSHAHLTSPAVDEHLEQFLLDAQQNHICKIVNICTDLNTLQKGVELKKKCPWIYNTAATTPHDVQKEGEEMFEGIADAARNGLLVGIGETGLDYYYTHSSKEFQQHFFHRYIQLALECELPLVIHCRDAFQDFFKIIDQYPKIKGILHCFTGTLEEAKELLKREWTISFSGILTFKKSQELKRVAQYVPLEKILIETDTPYLAPQKYRGKINQPAYVVEVAATIAALKKIPIEDVSQITVSNAIKIFQF